MTIYYPLPLVGADTPYVECLSSYVGRLAFAHSVTVGDLLADIVTRSGVLRCWRDTRSAAIASECGAIDGISTAASVVLRCLVEWTGQQNLRQSNLIFLSNQVAHVAPGTIKRNRCWCAECYRDMERDSVHEPLYWRVAGIKRCHIHRRPLDEHCPRCGATQPIVGWPIGRLQCCTCRAPLLRRAKKKVSSLTPGSGPEAAWQEWLCSQLVELFSMNARDDRLVRLPAGRFSEFLKELRKRLDLSWIDIQDLFELPETIHTWGYGGSRPSLANLFLVCACAKVDVAGVLLYPGEAAASVVPANLTAVRRASASLAHGARIERNRVLIAKCRAIVADWPLTIMPTVSAICDTAGLEGYSCLYLHAPELIKQIHAMQARFRRDQRAKVYARSREFFERLRADNPSLSRWALTRKMARESGCPYQMARQIAESLSSAI